MKARKYNWKMSRNGRRNYCFERKKLDSEKEELKQVVENTKKYHLLCGKLSEIQEQYVDKAQIAKEERQSMISHIEHFRWTGECWQSI